MQIFSVVLKLIPMNTAQMSSKCGKEYEKSSENSLKNMKVKKKKHIQWVRVMSIIKKEANEEH